MIVKYGGIEYVVADSAIRWARRAFAGKRARSVGLHVDAVRAGMWKRTAWSHRHAVLYADGRIDAWTGTARASVGLAENVVSNLVSRLVKRWVAEGYLVRVRRGVYRLAAASKRGGK